MQEVESPSVLFTSVWKTLYDEDEKVALHNEDVMGTLNSIIENLVPVTVPDVSDNEAPDSYTGPRLPKVIDGKFITELIDLFTEHAANSSLEFILHEIYAHNLVESVVDILKSEKAFNDITVPSNGHLTVIGDTHGQLLDVLTIFKMRGMPSDENIFLFNGDFVDRGPHGVEVLLLLYALKVQNPKAIYLNRGNHEHRRMNAKYGFEDQVMDRYDPSMYEHIQTSFEYLPIGAIIGNEIIVVHGGLFPHKGVTLDELRSQFKQHRINYRTQLPRHSEITSREQQIMEALVWSDPRNIVGVAKSKRGAGFQFGADISQRFLDKNKLSLLIRSHECEDAGYAINHNDRVITIFSASYYSGTHKNQGAVIVFDGKEIADGPLKPSYKQFYASAYAMTSEEVEEKLMAQSITQLREKIFVTRNALLSAFRTKQSEAAMIPLKAWELCMKEELGLPLPFVALLPYLASKTVVVAGTINYVHFLSQFNIKTSSKMKSWIRKQTKEIQRELAMKYKSIENAFTVADVNGDGELSYEEFVTVMKSLAPELTYSDEQILDLAMELDVNKDGSLQYHEFMDCLNVTSFCPDAWTTEQFSMLYAKIMEKGGFHDAHIAFKQSTGGHSGAKYSQLGLWFNDYLECNYSKEEVTKLATVIDENRSKKVSYKELKNAFLPKEMTSDSLLSEFIASFACAKVQLKSAFRRLDGNGSGSLDKKEFVTAMNAFNNLLNSPLPEASLESLFDTLDANNDGTVDYNELVSALAVVPEF